MMLTPRSVGLMVAAALAAGWLGASLTEAPPPAQSAQAVAGPRPLGSPAPMPRPENLHRRTSEPPLPSRGRNPFVYGARSPIRSTTLYRDRPGAPVETPTAAYQPPVPAMPILRLSGIASNEEDGTIVLTAILNDNGAMVFAKAGERLSNGYSVVRIDETSVTLVDAAGITQTIRLP